MLERRLAVGGRPVADSGEALQRLLEQLAPDALTAFEYPLLSWGLPCSPDVSQRVESPEQADELADRTADARLAGWLRRWSRSRRDKVGHLARLRVAWLEYDLQRSGAPGAVVCLRLPREGVPPGGGPLGRWLRELPDDPSGPRSRRQRLAVERCAALAPASARPLYLFDLSARRAGDVRLELYGPPVASMADYLAAIGAPVPAWLDRLDTWIGDADRVHLSFDFDGDGTIGERIGVEASYVPLPQRDPRWTALFARLEAAGLCSAHAVEGIHAWLGQEDRREMPESWPAHPALRRGRFVRLLSHVKIVGPADGEPTAKVYLLFRFIERRRVRRRG